MRVKERRSDRKKKEERENNWKKNENSLDIGRKGGEGERTRDKGREEGYGNGGG